MVAKRGIRIWINRTNEKKDVYMQTSIKTKGRKCKLLKAKMLFSCDEEKSTLAWNQFLWAFLMAWTFRSSFKFLHTWWIYFFGKNINKKNFFKSSSWPPWQNLIYIQINLVFHLYIKYHVWYVDSYWYLLCRTYNFIIAGISSIFQIIEIEVEIFLKLDFDISYLFNSHFQ